MISFLDSAALSQFLPYPALIEALRQSFQENKVNVPPRHHYMIDKEGEAAQTLLLMPAWDAKTNIGLKMVTVTPGNEKRNLPAIQGIYILLDDATGKPIMLLDGPTLTARRTAAASALAGTYLAKKTLRQMLMVGTGALSLPLMEAHAACHAIEQIFLWGRDREKAEAKAKEARKAGLPVEAVADLAMVAQSADLISCATLSSSPLIKGEWLEPGCHLDLVGGFTPKMREADDEAIAKSRIFVDTRQGALHEAGDIVDPISRGIIPIEKIEADLFDLCQGKHSGRKGGQEITFFKSVGTAIEDFAAAQLAFQAYSISAK